MLYVILKFDLKNACLYVFTLGCEGAQTADTGSLALVL